MIFDNIGYWMIPLLVGVIFGLIGYLMGKSKRKVEVIDKIEELKTLHDRNAKLQADLDACNAGHKTQSADFDAALLDVGTAVIAFDAIAAKAAFGKKIKENDLKVVEGIGPKIEQLFHGFGIKTWQALSDVTVAKCQEVLDSGGKRYRVHDPASWPMQAKMAFKGEWKNLVKWQDKHKAGKL